MDHLNVIVAEEVRKYAGSGRGARLRLFALLDDEHQHYAVTAVHDPRAGRPMAVVVMAQVVGQYVVIEEDRTDKPLLDALLQRGLTREQIILAYNGEQTPEGIH